MRRLIAVTGVAVVMLLASLAGTTPAHGDTARALALCRAGAGGNIFNTNVVVNQQPATFGVRHEIWPGDVLRVTATGGIRNDGWPWTPHHSPDGVAEAAPDRSFWRAAGLRKFSLVGTFNDTGEQVQLGSDSGCFVYRGAPRTFLWLSMNDDFPLDNSGQWNVVVRLFA